MQSASLVDLMMKELFGERLCSGPFDLCLPFLSHDTEQSSQSLYGQLLDKWFEESGKIQLLRDVCFSDLPGGKKCA